jgi:hypothetical protein
MSKDERVFIRRHIAEDMPEQAILRKDVELLRDEMVPLRCIDMAYPSLTRLQHLRDELSFFDMPVDPTYQIPCEPWEKGQSHIISVAEIEGGLFPRMFPRQTRQTRLLTRQTQLVPRQTQPKVQSKLRQAHPNLPQMPWTRKRSWTSG